MLDRDQSLRTVDNRSFLLEKQFEELLGENFNQNEVQKIIRRGSMQTIGDLEAVMQIYRERLNCAKSEIEKKSIQKELANEISGFIIKKLD